MRIHFYQFVIAALALATTAAAQAKPRAHDLAVPIGGTRGPLNAITDTHSVGVVRDAIIAWQMKRPGLL
jgi:hypothetical protein